MVTVSLRWPLLRRGWGGREGKDAGGGAKGAKDMAAIDFMRRRGSDAPLGVGANLAYQFGVHQAGPSGTGTLDRGRDAAYNPRKLRTEKTCGAQFYYSYCR